MSNATNGHDHAIALAEPMDGLLTPFRRRTARQSIRPTGTGTRAT